jgi:glycosyltransferase involved in cell wall biosynthesis
MTSTINLGATKIAIFLPSLNGGGAERVMVTLANAFSERGYAVDLVLAKVQGPFLSNVLPSVRIVDLKVDRVIMSLLPLIRYLRRNRPTAMLVAMTHTNLVAILARMLSASSTRLVVSERSTISVDRSKAQGLVARIIYALVPKLYPYADCIIAVSQASSVDLERYANLPEASVKVIYNPFDLEYIKGSAAEALDHPWFRPGQPPVVLGIGRLTEQKDFSSLIFAFAKLRQKGSTLRLMILGEGELRANLEADVAECGLTADDVQMPGFVSNPYAYLARCAVFVLSSRWEGLPGVLIEAMACGATVISTDCPSGPSEILEGGRWGALVPMGDVSILALEIAEALNRTHHPEVIKRSAFFAVGPAVDKYMSTLMKESWT